MTKDFIDTHIENLEAEVTRLTEANEWLELELLHVQDDANAWEIEFAARYKANARMEGALEDILTADPTATWEGLLAIARHGLGRE